MAEGKKKKNINQKREEMKIIEEVVDKNIVEKVQQKLTNIE